MAFSQISKLYWTCTPKLDITKPTVIFIHAAWMSSSMFTETIETLSPTLPKVNFLSIDLNSHGKTIAGRKTFTLWDQATDVVTLMGELQIPEATFIGISMGAVISLGLALSHPNRVSALVLLAATAAAASPESIAGINYVRDIWVSTPSPSEEIMNIAICGWGGDPDVNSDYAQEIKRHWVELHSGKENVDAVLESVNGREDLMGSLGEVRGKVLLVHGEDDQTWGLKEAENLRDGLVNADVRFEVVRGGGHLVVGMGGSEKVVEWIAEFVEEVLEGS